jgi:protein-L-isoaspartate(D-aspartate) O-methyltransferase
VPQPLIDQLAEGGKLIVPLGKRYHQSFYLFEKRGSQLIENKLLATLFVPMAGIAESQRKEQENSARPRLANGGFEQATDDVADEWFYQRQATLEHKGAREGKSYIQFTNREMGRDAHALQAIGVDGKKVRSMKITLWVKADDNFPGRELYQKPGLAIRFFDVNNKKLSEEVFGPWLGTFPWRHVTSHEMRIPKEAKMAMIQMHVRLAQGGLAEARYGAGGEGIALGVLVIAHQH